MRATLQGLPVLVTRPIDQAEGFAQVIRAAGGSPKVFPLLDITAVADTRTLYGQLAQLCDYDLVIFISPNAVSYGMAAIAAAGAVLAAQVATMGAGSARALREAGVNDVIVPTERSDSEGLLAMPALAQLSGKRVMILRGDGGRELLADTLKARGATVDYVTCYQRSKTNKKLDDLKQLHPEVLTVTSSEALGHLREMMGRDAALLTMPLFVPHSRIAELAAQLGWREVILTDAGDAGLLVSLLAWRNTRGAT